MGLCSARRWARLLELGMCLCEERICGLKRGSGEISGRWGGREKRRRITHGEGGSAPEAVAGVLLLAYPAIEASSQKTPLSVVLFVLFLFLFVLSIEISLPVALSRQQPPHQSRSHPPVQLVQSPSQRIRGQNAVRRPPMGLLVRALAVGPIVRSAPL